MFALEKWNEAVGFYARSLQYVPQDPAGYYNMGAAYTNKHDAPSAVASFQKVIELDPTGHDGIEAAKAIEKLRAGTIGQKGFTGSWKVVTVLGGLTLFSIAMMGHAPEPSPLLNLMVWGGSLVLYCWRKYK
jgi:tetratricopeptide (TPR) repeat protein